MTQGPNSKQLVLIQFKPQTVKTQKSNCDITAKTYILTTQKQQKCDKTYKPNF